MSTNTIWKLVGSAVAAIAAFIALRLFGAFFTTFWGCALGALVAAVLVWKFVAVWELQRLVAQAQATGQNVISQVKKV